jgi:phosphoribosylamine--glycine ligase
MLTKSGPKILEFNCRLGDPEAQAILARADFDLAEVLADVAAGRLDSRKLQWLPGASACLVLASGGYPAKFKTGNLITGLAAAERFPDVKVLHAGTTRQSATDGDVEIITNGGRVLGITAIGTTLDAALEAVYRAAGEIHFDGMHYRRDIGRVTALCGGNAA